MPLLETDRVERFRAVVARRLGLQFDQSKLGFLADVLRQRAGASNDAVDRYLHGLEVSEEPPEVLRALVPELTVTETYFFRHADQLRAFGDVLLTARAQRPERPTFRILSAGCASGEEPYSLAMLARELVPHLTPAELSIRAFDLNSVMLAKAARARYGSWALRETSAAAQARWFRSEGRDFVVDPTIAGMVTFEEKNLIENDPHFWRENLFDVVFCRNVIMYFAPETARAVIARISRSLAPGGYLFLGSAETLRGLSQDFHLRHTHGTFYYQRRDSAVHPSRDTHVPWDGESHPPATPAVDTDTSWIENIRRASERVHSLTTPELPASANRPDAPLPVLPIRSTLYDVASAMELLRKERFSDARATLLALPSESARDPDVLLLDAALLTHGGDLVAAEKVCERLIEIDGMSAGAHYLQALCREHAGDRVGAIEHDQIATYLDPGFAMPRLHLGLLARKSGDHEAARRELGQAFVLLEREDSSRLLLFGGGFTRETLVGLCRAELVSCGGVP